MTTTIPLQPTSKLARFKSHTDRLDDALARLTAARNAAATEDPSWADVAQMCDLANMLEPIAEMADSWGSSWSATRKA